MFVMRWMLQGPHGERQRQYTVEKRRGNCKSQKTLQEVTTHLGSWDVCHTGRKLQQSDGKAREVLGDVTFGSSR